MRIPGVSAIVLVTMAASTAAQPVPKENTGRVSYTGKNPASSQPVRDGDWIQLASPTPASHGTEFVVIGKEAGEFGQLRITPSEGKVVVRRVKIYFDDGKQKTVDLDKVIDARHQRSAVIDLDTPKPIDRVVVTTEPYGGGSYAVYGAPGTSGVARK